MKRIRVLIVEDSQVVRHLLMAIIGEDPRLEVAAAFTNAEEALRKLDQIAPDVISLDIRLPGMNGLDATRRIMAERPTPIVVIAASVESDDLSITMNALRAGALAVIEKPCGVETEGFDVVADNIRTQLYIMSQVKVVRQRSIGRSVTIPAIESLAPLPPIPGRTKVRALAIGCSTGGPNALAVVLKALPPDLPCPILVVQHIPPTFVGSFASWIAGICPFEVRIVSHAEILRDGCIYLSAAERHLTVTGTTITTTGEPPLAGQRPSATILFRSVALAFGPSAVGLLMTGMGDDGAAGLLSMRKAGAFTIAEDQSTAVVYGMPAAAVACGAVCESLPLPAIARRLTDLVGLPVVSGGEHV